MSDAPCRVYVVVDPHYGERIRNLPFGEPAWIVDSADNHPVIQAIWEERGPLDKSAGTTSFKYDPDAQPDGLTGITSFKYNPNARPDNWLISILSVIDEHHYYHDPPYSVLNIVGTSWSEAIQEELDRFGFFAHEATTEGFVTKRDLADAEPPILGATG
jgi:hypothetical protein